MPIGPASGPATPQIASQYIFFDSDVIPQQSDVIPLHCQSSALHSQSSAD